MRTWTRYENAFLNNPVTCAFLDKWIRTRGNVGKATASELTVAFESIRTDGARTAFADLLVEMNVVFRKEDHERAIKNLRDNSPEARQFRVAAYSLNRGIKINLDKKLKVV